MMEKVVLGLGSNVGNRLRNTKKALKFISLSPILDILTISPIYETEPWGFKNQNNFLNCVLVCICRSEPLELINEVKEIEKKVGRKYRNRWYPREIDIDILFFGNKKVCYKDLIIPHSQIQYRNFILKPLADLMPEFIHPVLNKTNRNIYKHSKDSCEVKLYKYQLIH